jgi:hypothetical protein
VNDLKSSSGASLPQRAEAAAGVAVIATALLEFAKHQQQAAQAVQATLAPAIAALAAQQRQAAQAEFAALGPALEMFAEQQRAVVRPALEAIPEQQRKSLAPALKAIAAQQRDVLAPALQAFAEQQGQILERFALSAQLVGQLNVDAISATLETFGAQTTALLNSFQLPEGLIEGFRRLGWELPSSWPADRTEEVYEMVRVTGVPIGSLAPAHVVEACLGEFTDGRDPYGVLHDHRDELVDVLAEYAARMAGLDDASDAHRGFLGLVELLQANRHHRAVVVSAFTIVDDLLYKVTHQSYGAISADRLDGGFEEQSLVGFRRQVAVHCLAPCYARFDKASGERPTALNRHAAVHTASPMQATPEHALIAALLVANLLDATFNDLVG